MEKVKTIIQTFLFLMLVGVWSISETIYGQTRQVGDLYTFDDGTQGVVFYVDADNPNSGWVVALNDMDTVYALHSNGYLPTSLLGYAQDFPYSTTLDSWNYYGKNVTQSLKNTGNPNWVAAVNAVGSDWYIPDAMQMRLIYGLFPMLENAFEAAGGDYSALLQQDHWTSSVPPYQRSLLVFHADGTVESYALNQSFAIRLIRDYEDQPIAFWADAPRNNVMEVSPPTTSDYDALIVYLSDTVVITKEVEVYETFEKDTIYEQTEVSEIPYTSPTDALFSNIDVSAPGDYVFHSRMNTMHGCDSVITLMLRVDNHTYYADSLCSLHEDYYFAPFDTLFRPGTISGRYEHHGSKVTDNGTIDTIAYYDLTIWPEYEQFDTVKWCLYETVSEMNYDQNPNISLRMDDGHLSVVSLSEEVTVESVTSSDDYVLKMKTVHGCDSLVYLHVDVSSVMRDTSYYDVFVEQVENGQITVDEHVFSDITTAGAYIRSDTLRGSNGCDSISTIVLIIESLHQDSICGRTFTSEYSWSDNLEGYQWHEQSLPEYLGMSGYYEFPGQKAMNGVLVDTISYLHLTILPTYQAYDTVTICLYENSVTIPYDLSPEVTISVEGDQVSVSSSDVTLIEILSVSSPKFDFVLKMKTIEGCDSLVYLHVKPLKVSRDTIRKEVFLYQVEDERVVVEHHVFENIEEAGFYDWHDTLTGANGCDSIVVLELNVSPCITDFSISCPPSVYDTLAFGDCAMKIYPDRIGDPTILCEEEWPFLISNDIPNDLLFYQGDNVITWVLTDTVCGFTDTCEQHIVIAYPKCPDAVDCEGNVYHGVRIGCDCWTQRNLESTKYSDCEAIANVYAYVSLQYPDTAANVATYGRLYTYEAAIRDGVDNGYGHVQGICPAGWYLPTSEKYIGLNAYGSHALKSPLYWLDGGGDNSTGFTALPAGYYNGARNRYEGLLSETYFWSTQNVGYETVNNTSIVRHDCDAVLMNHSLSGLGYSVRCIKEKE